MAIRKLVEGLHIKQAEQLRPDTMTFSMLPTLKLLISCERWIRYFIQLYLTQPLTLNIIHTVALTVI